MKKKNVIAFLLSLVVTAGSMSFLYQDEIKGMISMGGDYINGILNPVTSSPDDSDLKVESISIDTTNVKMEYAFAEKFTVEGLKVIATMSDGSEKEIDVNDCTILEPDTTLIGTRNVIVSYEGKTSSYEIIVNPKVMPPIPTTSLLDITEENDSVPYRVEAEAIDMETPGVKKAEGITDFVATAPIDADITSGDKYLTGYNVQWNYFGFTFTAAEDFENTTLVLRVANSAGMLLNAGNVKMYLNYTQDEKGNPFGEIPLDDIIIQPGVCQWTDIVLRGIDIPAGTNTLTFEMQSNYVFDIDYIDFYVGMRYISSTVDINNDETIVKEFETFDTEKAYTREDVAEAWGLVDGQLFIETVDPSNEEPGKPTSGGTDVAAIGKGSQLTTTLRLAKDATVRIKMKASAVNRGAYYVSENWNFEIDGYKLTLVERINIEGGNAQENRWWDWMYTEIGTYNLTAGDHLFFVETTGTDCNVDTFEFEIVSWGEFAQDGSDLDSQHICESVCPHCGGCLDFDCTWPPCAEKCVGHDGSAATLGAGKTKVELEKLDLANSTIDTREDFIAAYGIAEGDVWRQDGKIFGFHSGTFVMKLTVKKAGQVKISIAGCCGSAGALADDMTFKFGDEVIIPNEELTLIGASVKEAEVGIVNVPAAGDYIFTFTVAQAYDLDYVSFEMDGEGEPEQPEVTPDVVVGEEGVTKVEFEELNLSKSTIDTRDDFIAAYGIAEGDVFRNAGRIYGFVNGTFVMDVKVEKAGQVKIVIAGFRDGAANLAEEMTFTFDGTAIVPEAGVTLAGGEVIEAVVGTVNVTEAGIYRFSIEVKAGYDLDYVVFEVVA